MTIIDVERQTEAPHGDLDGPMLAHICEAHLFEEGAVDVALCGTRLIGIPAGDNPPNPCPKCLDVIEEAFGDRVWPRAASNFEFLPEFKEKYE